METDMKNCVVPAPMPPHIADMIDELEKQQERISDMISGLEFRLDRKPEVVSSNKKGDCGYRLRLANMIDANIEIIHSLERITVSM